MRPQSFDSVEFTGSTEALPLRLSQRTETAPTLINLALMATLAGFVVLPQIGLAVHAMSLPATRAQIIAEPLLAVELSTALAFWIALFAWPLKRLTGRIKLAREVLITPETVIVQDHSLFGSKAWSAPLSSYHGLAHHLRSSLSSTHHELFLAHSDKTKSILLLTREHISGADIRRFGRLLGLQQVAAKELYSRRNAASKHVAGEPAPVALAA